MKYVQLATIAALAVLTLLGVLPDMPAEAVFAFSGLFSFGGSKSKQQSTSEASSYGYQGSSSLSEALSRAGSFGTSQSSQRIAFEDMFSKLFGDATGAAEKASAMVPALQGQAAQLFGAGTSFLDQLQGGTGQEYLEGRLTGDGLVDEQIGFLGEDIGRFLRDEVNPAITSRGVATGTLGGGRQGVAQGRAASAAVEQFQRGATGLRTADRAARDAAARDLMAGRTAGAQAGLGALPGVFGLAESGAGAQLAPFMALAQIMGGPTVLGQSTSLDQSFSNSISRAIAEAFGEDFSKSKSQSTGSSKAFNIGFGGGGGQ